MTLKIALGGAKNCPCRGCNNRTIECHSKCKAYKKYQDQTEKMRKAMKYNKISNYSTGWGYMRKRKQRGH